MSRARAAVTAALALAGCHPTERFESVTQYVRKDVVIADEKGTPTLIDVELEWDPCPGDQFQVVRGDTAFAECMGQYQIGDLLPVVAEHRWDTRGYWEWDVAQVGACPRPIEDGEGAYEKSQECKDVVDYGTRTGFKCSRRPFAELVSVCPWMARD